MDKNHAISILQASHSKLAVFSPDPWSAKIGVKDKGSIFTLEILFNFKIQGVI
jgi:hypothetical protein